MKEEVQSVRIENAIETEKEIEKFEKEEHAEAKKEKRADDKKKKKK